MLTITGGWSPTFEAVGKIAADLTGGRHVVVPSPNHFVQMMAANAFNEAAVQFMKAADAAGRLTHTQSSPALVIS